MYIYIYNILYTMYIIITMYHVSLSLNVYNDPIQMDGTSAPRAAIIWPHRAAVQVRRVSSSTLTPCQGRAWPLGWNMRGPWYSNSST